MYILLYSDITLYIYVYILVNKNRNVFPPIIHAYNLEQNSIIYN